ncbi:MAG TPA: hypothetical protein VH247_09000 [Thermoleophilaceae bacterium]|nr:hypothetical protein [Thermoleophilaceae bacterium]
MPKGQGKYLVISSLILALLAAPIALAANGDPVTAGGRTTFTKITRVLGDSTTYATQQSNLHSGDGGAARYGCRSSAANEFCLLSKNTGGGGSFRFQSLNSLLGGSIEVNPPQGKTAADAKPFTTNAHGVATGLNADQVDGMSADDIVKAAKGSEATYALLSADGKTNGSRTQGVKDTNVVHTTAGVYCFTGLAAQPQTANVSLDGTNGETSVDTTTNNPGAACNNATGIQLIVRTYDSAGTLADKPFYVQVG